MTHESIQDLLPFYALGALEPDERRLVEKALAGDPALEAELAEWSAVVEGVATGVEPLEVSEIARARLLRRLPAQPPRQAATRSSLGWAAAGALFLLGAWLTWINFELRNHADALTADRDLAVVKASRLARDLQEARSDLRRLAAAQRIVGAPGAGTVRLAALDGAAGGSANTYVDPVHRRAAFFASELPPAPRQHTYQLWFIADGTPVSAGVFDVELDGTALLIVDDVAPAESIQAWAVTVEPEGGVPQPTGPMVLKG